MKVSDFVTACLLIVVVTLLGIRLELLGKRITENRDAMFRLFDAHAAAIESLYHSSQTNANCLINVAELVKQLELRTRRPQ